MQFQVPQFLDVEDKIIGPLTIKQFLYLIGGFGMGYLSFHFIPWIVISIIPAAGFVALGAALAFYKINKKPFVYTIEAAFNYMRGTRMYVWKRREKKGSELDLSNFKTTKHVELGVPSAGGSKLGDLAWSIDVEKATADVSTQKVTGAGF